MNGVTPWVPVEPSSVPAAILGRLPLAQGSVSYAIPASVVPDGATGILVFAWAALSGINPGSAYWHVGVDAGGGTRNWFSLLIAGDPSGTSVNSQSQAFWLPFPADRAVTVTLFANDLPSPSNAGEVEVHGYLPGAPAAGRRR